MKNRRSLHYSRSHDTLPKLSIKEKQSKLVTLEDEIQDLENAVVQYNEHLHKQRKLQNLMSRAIEDIITFSRIDDLSESDVLNYINHKLSDSCYQFFRCQLGSRKNRACRWNIKSLEIPVIANRWLILVLFLLQTQFLFVIYVSQFTVETYGFADGQCLFRQPRNITYHWSQYDGIKKKSVGPSNRLCLSVRSFVTLK